MAPNGRRNGAKAIAANAKASVTYRGGPITGSSRNRRAWQSLQGSALLTDLDDSGYKRSGTVWSQPLSATEEMGNDQICQGSEVDWHLRGRGGRLRDDDRLAAAGASSLRPAELGAAAGL